MATVSELELENPKNSSDLKSKHPAEDDVLTHTPTSSHGGDDDESKDELTAASRTSHNHETSAVTDIDKKLMRAERFGMPVQMTEEEKRNSRAERFGTGTAVNGSNTCNASEDLKKKSRAERFGIVQSDPSDEEAKKKARLSRFGSIPKSDSGEEDKKKARAIRFSQLESITGSKTKMKENVEVKTDTASEAGGGI